MIASPSRRLRLQSAVAFAAFVLAAGLVAFAGQPPEVEDPKAKTVKKKVSVEDEDPKGTIKKKIDVPDDPDPKSTGGGGGGSTPDTRLDELAGAAGEATHPAVKTVLKRYAVPFDRLTEKNESTVRIRPFLLQWGKDEFPKNKAFNVVPLNVDNVPQEPRPITVADVKKLDSFEHLVFVEVEQWLKQKPVGQGPGPADLTGEDQLGAAEKLLAAALRFHDYARQNGIRTGKAWDDVRKPLVDRLLDVRLQQLRRAVGGSDWQRARQFGTALMRAYPKDGTVAKEVAIARVAEADLLMKSNSHGDRVKARELLDEFESRFPDAGGERVREIRKTLSSEAARLFEQAKGFKLAGNAAEARNHLERAEALDQNIAGLREMKREIGSGYPVLYVGVRAFPERMSPATARLDSEKQAVELLFEGLLEEVPNGNDGVRYRSGTAIGPPSVIPGGRELFIRQVPRAVDGMQGFDAHDVVETVKFLRTRPELPASAGLPWIEGLPTPIDGGSLRIAFAHGHPDPRSLLTFKLLPGRWLADRGKAIDDPDFAARPFGTGPFRLLSVPGPGDPPPREMVFVDNPAYGRSRDRTGQPHLREIRFVELPKLTDPFDDFKRGRLHIIPDLSPLEMNRALNKGGDELGGKGLVVTAATNRRVHILAVNHRRPPLQNRDLRKGLALAIDREAILNDLFRAAPPQFRRSTFAMSGPFPPNSWATYKSPNGLPVPIVNRDEALIRLKRYLAAPGALPELKLAYSTADSQAQGACEKIKTHIESLFKDAPDGQKLTIALEGVDARELTRRVDDEYRYDLAYVPFDYADDWYPYGLAAALDPTAATRGGRNFTGFRSADAKPDEADHTLGAELAGLIEYRDFTGKIVPRAVRIHNAFNDTVPFVPLWQLDRYMLVNSGLKVFVDDATEPTPIQILNPTLLFQNVGRWRLE